MHDSVLSILPALFPWFLPASLLIKCYFNFHFTDEETDGLSNSLKVLELISGSAEIWTKGVSQSELGHLNH
jgi:hypothetical protein